MPRGYNGVPGALMPFIQFLWLLSPYTQSRPYDASGRSSARMPGKRLRFRFLTEKLGKQVFYNANGVPSASLLEV